MLSKPNKPWLLYAILSGSFAINLAMILDPSSDDNPSEPDANISANSIATPPALDTNLALAATNNNDLEVEVTTEPLPIENAEIVPITSALTNSSAPHSSTRIDSGFNTGQWTRLETTVEHSLARTFQKAAGDNGNALSAVYARLFTWDLDLRKDLMPGDQIEVAWRRDSEGQIEIASARLFSNKLRRTLTAYRWRLPGDTYASYWSDDGSEVPMRLVGSPLEQYTQITAVMGGRVSHAGMDFKTPTGTPVKSPYNGEVTRINWNTAANGNCIEVRYEDGTLAKFLHLSSEDVKIGETVAAGQIIGRTGNTGRSTAPHLHYQLNKGKRAINPIHYHGTLRRRIPTEHINALAQRIISLDELLEEPIASR